MTYYDEFTGQTIGVKENFKRFTLLYARKFKVVSLTLTFTAHSHRRNIYNVPLFLGSI